MDTSTLRAVGDQKYFSYYGDREDWFMVVNQSRDSDALEQSNFRVIRADLESRFPSSTAVERFGHFLVGWTESLLVEPADTDAVAAVLAWREELQDYPVADDEDFSSLEYEETLQNIDACGSDAVAMGHSTPPGVWDCPNGYRYQYVCAHCGQEIAVDGVGGSWTLPECVTDECV